MLIKFLLADVLRFHSQLDDKSAGVRDLGLIESAVNAPFQTFGGQDLYPTIFDKAAQLAGKLSSAALSEWLKLNSVETDTKKFFDGGVCI